MKRGALLRKVLVVVILSLTLTVVFTVAIYNVLSRMVFSAAKSKELMPKARALGALAYESMGEGEEGRALRDIFRRMDPSVLGAYFAVLNEQGDIVFSSRELDVSQIGSAPEMIERVLKGEEVTANTRSAASQVVLVGVGAPIQKEGDRRGGILLFLPMYEAFAALSSLNLALFISLACVIPIVIVLVYLAMERVVRPLRQMERVALSMASGDYSVRADDRQKGEVGQLGMALNHLAQELSRTVGALTLERNRLKQSVDGLSEGFVSVNAQGEVTHHNPAVAALFSSAVREGETGRAALIPVEAVWADFDQAIRENRMALRDTEVGGRMIHSIISPLAGEQGEAVGAVGLFSDVTESERLERTRRDYVANVSHELRTPLTAMRALIEPIRDGMVASRETRQRYYDIIHREILRLSRLIDDLMELSRLQSGQLAVNLEAMALEEMISDLAEKYGAAAEEKGLTFHLDFRPQDCPEVCSNADRVEQVMVILLDNAMKYTPEGGEIHLGARWDGERVVLSVRDTGIGISPEDLPYVFDRFFKADKSRTGSTGSGLGLSIARETLQRMGEEICVRSQSGQGSEFSFTLKRAGS